MYTTVEMFGGDLGPSSVFSKIMSIGFEFETHDLAKLSLVQPNILINSSMTIRTMKQKQDANEATKIDDHMYEIIEFPYFYEEYIDEPDDASTKEGSNAVMLQVTNDIATTEFGQELIDKCKKSTKRKQFMTFIPTKTKANHEPFHIEFTSEMTENISRCSMSGVEFIVTFYHPKRSPNIIMETFLDSCRRIFVHLSNLKKIRGGLWVNQPKPRPGIPVTFRNRTLFHKPDTNLYYLQTHDGDISMSIEQIQFTPQMTFRSYVYDLVPILEEILKRSPLSHDSRRTKQLIKSTFTYEIDSVQNVKNCITELLKVYNRTAPRNKTIAQSSRFGKTVSGYLFLILYKLYMYINDYVPSLNRDIEENYFKNYLTFASRHYNIDLYTRLKTIIVEQFTDVDAVQLILQIIDQPVLLRQFIFDTDKPNTPLLNKKHPNYGDPSVSFMSYFAYFESTKHDWLIDYNIDEFSTKFDIGPSDEIMVENRLFNSEYEYFIKQVCDVSVVNTNSTVRTLRTVYDALITNSTQLKGERTKYATTNIGKLEYNPRTRRHIMKCAPGQTRNKHFQCLNKKMLHK